MNDRIKPDSETKKEKPLHEMTLDELQLELHFREGMRHMYDGGRKKLHATLQARVDRVLKHISAVENGTKIDPESEEE